MSYQDVKFDKESVFLVGGGAGFIGSNICEALINMGYTYDAWTICLRENTKILNSL